MDVNHDCAQAKQLLREHCGYENKITTAYMEKDFALLACKCIIREKMFPKDFHWLSVTAAFVYKIKLQIQQIKSLRLLFNIIFDIFAVV